MSAKLPPDSCLLTHLWSDITLLLVPLFSSGIEALSNLKFKRGTVDNIDGDLQSLVFEFKAGNKRLMEEIRHITAEEESLKSEVAELSRRKTMFQANIITLDKFVEYDKDFII